MKRVKHFITIILILAVAILPTGCGGTPEPAEFLSMVTEKNEECLKYEGSTTMEMELSMLGETVNYEILVDMAMDFTDMEAPKMVMESSTSYAGMAVDMNVYYNEGYAYMDMMGMKIKSKAPIDVLDGYYGTSMDIQSVENMTNIELTEVDGNYLITFDLTSEEMENVLNEMMGPMLDGYDVSNDSDGLEYTKVETSILADKDGNLISQNIEMDMVMTIEGMEVEMSTVAIIEYTALGDDVVIEFPDFSDYIESEIPAAF